MKHIARKSPQKLALIASTLALSLLLSACGGGGDATPPVVGDTTPPTVAITDNVPGVATGDVTFTFTASEALAASSFTASDVVVNGGTKGALTVVNATTVTLVVTPTPNTIGNITIDLPAGSVTDLAGNATAVAATQVTQAYNTIPALSGNTGTCVATATVNCIGFQELALGYTPFGDIVTAEMADDPADASNKVGKIIKPSNTPTWAGVTLSTVAADKSLPIVGLSANKIVTLRVYSPAAGLPILLKLENAADNTKNIEKSVNTTKANAWETLSFDYTGFDATTVYNKISVFPNFGFVESSAKTYYFDELKYTIGAPPAAAALVFANNYAGATEAAWASAQGGSVGRYIDTSVATQDWWNGVGAVTDTVRSFYFGYGISSAAKPWGFGAFVKAPANGTANVSALSSVNLSVWGNDELMNTRPTLTVVLKGPAAGGCTPEIQGTIPSATPGSASLYTLAKASFTVKTSCPSFTTTDAIWAAGVNEVHFQVLGTQVQYVTLAPNSTLYANGLNIGPITFQ